MDMQTRRDFLARSAAVAGMTAVGGPGLWAAGQEPEPEKPADMAIAKWAGIPNPNPAQIRAIAVKLTEQALEAIGGLKRFVTKGSVVWVKPNIGWDKRPEMAANTNPDVVATIVKQCKEAGAKTVRVGDNSVNPAKRCYDVSGIAAAAMGTGVQVIYPDRYRFKEMDIKGEKVKTIPVFPGIVECDLVINVPVVKHHGATTATLCMKNYMGIVDKRDIIHQDLPTCIADLTRFMKPQICVLDAVRILTANGPTGGDLKDVQTKLMVAAGVDIVALDAWGCDVLGFGQIGTVQAGERAGLGKKNYRSLNLKEIAVK